MLELKSRYVWTGVNMRGLKTGQPVSYRHYLYLAALFCVCGVLFFSLQFFNGLYSILLEMSPYLTWHNIFELFSVLVSFSVFIVIYYTYQHNRNKRAMLIGVVFLLVGFVDLCHMLSYKGMPVFFSSDGCCANRATTFWIIGRLVAAAGIFASAFIPHKKKSCLHRVLWIVPAFAAGACIFVMVVYFPGIIPDMYIEGEGLTQVKVILEHMVIGLLLMACVLYIAEYNRTGDKFTLWFCAALIISIFSELSFVMYIDVYDVYNFMGHLFKVAAYFIIFRVKFVNNVQKPYEELSDAQKELKEYIDNLDRMVEQRTKQLKQLNRQFLSDLEYARDIQLSLMPHSMPQSELIFFEAAYFSAERVSGDFYDVFRIDNDNIGVYVGDVSGHGVSAAMLTVFVKQSIEAANRVAEQKLEMSRPSDVLNYLYGTFNSSNFQEEVYIVLLYAVFNTKTMQLSYSSAGLNVEPLYITDEGVERIDIKGFPICKFGKYYSAEYIDHVMTMKRGDRILLYTDGFTEARNRKEEQYTQERLMRLIEKNRDRTIKELSGLLSGDILTFMDDDIRDDITYVLMEVGPNAQIVP